MRAVLLASLLLSAAGASAQEPPLAWEGRLSLGPVFDSNPARTGGSDLDPSGGVSGVLSLDGSLRENEANETSLSLDAGARAFFQASSENQVAARGTLSHGLRVTDFLAPVVSIAGKHRHVSSGRQQESSEA